MVTWTSLRSVLACAGLILLVGPLQAGLIPVSVSITPEADRFRWTYAIVLPSDSQLRAGNSFTIYDFAGFVPESGSMPPGWVFSSVPIGPTPPEIIPFDDPTIANLSWIYTGESIIDGQTSLGSFSDGLLDTNITTTSVPVPGPQVPEPGTLALASLGLPVLGLGWFIQTRRTGRR
jgi:hypothetical protein